MKPNLSIIETIKESYRIFRVQFTKILLLALATLLPINVLQSLVINRMDNDSSFNALTESFYSMDPTQTEQSLEIMRDYSERMVPYLLVNLLLVVLSAVFTIALAKLVKDEGMHGALNKTYTYGEIIVINENDSELCDVGTVGDYLTFGIKMLPKYILTVLCFALIAMLGFMILFIPGLIVMLTMTILVPVLVYDDASAFAAVKRAFVVMVKKPVTIAYMLVSMVISDLFSIVVSEGIAMIPMNQVTTIIVDSLASTAIQFVLSAVTILPLVAYLDRVKE